MGHVVCPLRGAHAAVEKHRDQPGRPSFHVYKWKLNIRHNAPTVPEIGIGCSWGARG